MVELTYLKEKETIIQKLNVDCYGNNNLRIDLRTLVYNLVKVESIVYLRLFNEENEENYSILDNLKLINEVLLLLNSLYREFSLVIKQDDDGKKIIVHSSFGSYNYTEINCGDKTFSSYLEIKESIEFAEKVFNNVIV